MCGVIRRKFDFRSCPSRECCIEPTLSFGSPSREMLTLKNPKKYIMKLNKTKAILSALVAGSLAISMAGANAAVDYASGSLILGIRTSATDDPIFEFNLGQASLFRDNPNVGFLGNIGDILSDNYGASWYSSINLFFGVIGNASAGDTTDPQTIYVSQRRNNATSIATAPSGIGGTAIGTALTQFGDVAATFAAQDAEPGTGNKGVLFAADTAFLHTWQDYTNTGTFGLFGVGSGLQRFNFNNDQTIYGIEHVEGAVDLFRAVRPDSGPVSWTYETTIVITQSGDIYAVPEPSSYALIAGGLMAILFFRRRMNASLKA